jgi:hypothetical protein
MKGLERMRLQSSRFKKFRRNSGGVMRKALMVAVWAATLFLTAAAYQHGGHEHKSTAQLAPRDDYAARGVTAEADGKPGTIVGYLRDTACMYRVPTVTESTNDCMKQCIRAGAPLGIITIDGVLYHPISRKLPDSDVRKQLIPYAGHYVKAEGKLFERGGSHAIAIQKITVVPKTAK